MTSIVPRCRTERDGKRCRLPLHSITTPCVFEFYEGGIVSVESLSQPPPKPGKQDVTAFLLEHIAKRREQGLKKYGTSLQTWNGRDPLADAMEEDLDRMQYLVQARLERADMAERIAELAAALDKKQGLYLLARMIVHRIRDDGTLDSVEKIRALCASAMESLPVDEVDR